MERSESEDAPEFPKALSERLTNLTSEYEGFLIRCFAIAVCLHIAFEPSSKFHFITMVVCSGVVLKS